MLSLVCMYGHSLKDDGVIGGKPLINVVVIDNSTIEHFGENKLRTH